MLELRELVEKTYKAMPVDVRFSLAKEYSMQTFFHHSVSVACISYDIVKALGEFNKHKYGILKKISGKIATDMELEKILYLMGLVHDFVKIHRKHETGKERMLKIVRKITDGKNIEYEQLWRTALAVEGKADYELSSDVERYLVPIVRIADIIMSARSVDEAYSSLNSNAVIRSFVEELGLKIGYIKVIVPSIFYKLVSQKIIKLAENSGWKPLAVFWDGVLFIGSKKNKEKIMIKDIANTVYETIKEIIDEYNEDFLNNIVGNKNSNSLYVKIMNDVEELDENSVAEFVGNISKASFKVKGMYSYEFLSNVLWSKEELVEKIMEKIREKRDEKSALFSALMYFTVAHDSKNSRLLKELFGTDDLGRVTAKIFVAVKRGEGEQLLRRILDKLGTVDRFGEEYREELRRYVYDMVYHGIAGNMVEKREREFVAGAEKYKHYCRICGRPLYSTRIRFIRYGSLLSSKGSASEMWLNDDIAMGNLEKIAGENRYICPICFAEAMLIRKRVGAPYFVISLYPVVSYSLLAGVLGEKIRMLVDTVKNYIEESDRIKAEVLLETYNKLMGIETSGKQKDKNNGNGGKSSEDSENDESENDNDEEKDENEFSGLSVYDWLGADVLFGWNNIVERGEDVKMDIDSKDVALMLTIVPIILTELGCGQVSLVTGLHETYMATRKIVSSSYTPVLVDRVLMVREKINKKICREEKRDKNLEEYAVYNKIYKALLEVLLAYAMKTVLVHKTWSVNAKRKLIKYEDIASEVYYHLIARPEINIALLIPTKADMMFYTQGVFSKLFKKIYSLSREVEEYMNEVNQILDKSPNKSKEVFSVTSSLYRYTLVLAENVGDELSRSKVQKPLREALEKYLYYRSVLGRDDAENMAYNILVDRLSSLVGYDVASRVEIKSIVRKLDEIANRFGYGKARRFIEDVLDAVYSIYKVVKNKKNNKTEVSGV